MNVFIGIDPGQNGAIAAIDNNPNVMLLKDYPENEIAAARIVSDFLFELRRMQIGKIQIKAAIEKVHAMGRPGKPCPVCKRRPAQGVTSTFKFGTNYGIWKGILAYAQISFLEPPPQTWQKGVISKAQDKKPALAAAARMFPEAELYGPRGGGKDGRADALLIADWCRRQYVPEKEKEGA